MSKYTVVTPEALSKSFRPCELKNLSAQEADESFYYRYPSSSVIDQNNGDGSLFEILDWAKDFSFIDTLGGKIPTNPNTIVYLRKLTPKQLKETFDNHFDCYADTTDDSVVLAMTFDRFLEIVKRINPDLCTEK